MKSDLDPFKAWILDISIHNKGFLLWLKKASGEIVQALYPFNISFYAVLNEFNVSNSLNTSDQLIQEEKYKQVAASLRSHPNIHSILLSKCRIKAEDGFSSNCLCIKVDSPRHFKAVIKDIRKMEIFSLFNTDIPLVQIFLYQTKLFPFALCNVKLKSWKNLFQIISINLEDSNKNTYYDLPPLRAIWLELGTKSPGIKITHTDPIINWQIMIDPCSVEFSLSSLFKNVHNVQVSDEKPSKVSSSNLNEQELIFTLQNAINTIDPDIIFTKNGDETLFPYLLARLSYLKLEHSFTLSRDGSFLDKSRLSLNGSNSFMSYGIILHRSSSQFYLTGRLHIDSAVYGSLHFNDGNIFGIVEVGRVSYTPLQRLTRITIGGALQSLQFYHAYQQKILIPEEKKNAEFFQKSSNLLFSDRGGHILQPQVGLFERVAELDYTSMYPSLMVKYNVSPETINCSCCQENPQMVPGLPYHICKKRKGIVPLSLEIPLTKRIEYKKLSKEKGPDSLRYKRMDEALKWILVVCFGYLGFRNARFGRIEAHQTVCAYAREFLLNAVEIIEKYKYHPIHGIVDSLWIQTAFSIDNSQFDKDCTQIVSEIQQKTQIPIYYTGQEDRYDFICFLPTKSEPEIGALNRYWGKKINGNYKVRGIELRRHDAPVIIKHFQEDLMATIGTASSQERTTFPILLQKYILPLIIRYYEYLESDLVNSNDLAINIRLTRQPEAYKVQNYQAIASSFLQRLGAPVFPGQNISFIITNDKAQNPFERVLPLSLFQMSHHSYDVKKYKELIVRALVNLLPFPLSNEIKLQLMNLSGKIWKNPQKTQINLNRYFKI